MKKLRKIIPMLIGGILGIVLVGVVNIGLEPTPGITYNCTNEEKELIEGYLSYNNNKVLNLLERYNTTINTKDIVVSKKGYECYGYIQMSNKVITLDLEKGEIERSINHEIGHMVDYEYTDITLSLQDDFCEIWKEELDFFDDYYAGSSTECFAQSYKYYVEDNPDFKRECPSLWEYMDKLLKG
jgi:hypothetical protein